MFPTTHTVKTKKSMKYIPITGICPFCFGMGYHSTSLPKPTFERISDGRLEYRDSIQSPCTQCSGTGWVLGSLR